MIIGEGVETPKLGISTIKVCRAPNRAAAPGSLNKRIEKLKRHLAAQQHLMTCAIRSVFLCAFQVQAQAITAGKATTKPQTAGSAVLCRHTGVRHQQPRRT